jgi:hypothetical protein
MTGAHKTREAALEACIATAMEAPEFVAEGLTVRSCVCGRQDLHENPEISAIMDACTQCEVLVIGPGGTA